MVSSSLYFDPSRLQLARELRGMKKNELAAVLGVSSAAITSWENGARTPLYSNLAQLALSLGVPTSFLLKQSAAVQISEYAPHFRSLRSTSQVDRRKARAYIALVQQLRKFIEEEVESSSFSNLYALISDTSWDRAELREKVKLIRDFLGLGNKPLRHVLRTLEQQGITVVFGPADTPKVDAYSISDVMYPVIVLNPTKADYYRQRFDLAHEFGHVLMHFDSDPENRELEDEANNFASEFLAPLESIADDLPRNFGKDELNRLLHLKEKWGVSMQALLYRARAERILPEKEYKRYMILFSSLGWRKNEPGNVTILEAPSLFPGAVKLLSSDGFPAELIQEKTQIPAELFEVMTSRTPTYLESVQQEPQKLRVLQ